MSVFQKIKKTNKRYQKFCQSFLTLKVLFWIWTRCSERKTKTNQNKSSSRSQFRFWGRIKRLSSRQTTLFFFSLVKMNNWRHFFLSFITFKFRIHNTHLVCYTQNRKDTQSAKGLGLSLSVFLSLSFTLILCFVIFVLSFYFLTIWDNNVNKLIK